MVGPGRYVYLCLLLLLAGCNLSSAPDQRHFSTYTPMPTRIAPTVQPTPALLPTRLPLEAPPLPVSDTQSQGTATSVPLSLPPPNLCTASSAQGGDINIRKGPGREFDITGVLYPAHFIPVQGKSANGWYKVGSPELGSGWVSGSVTKLNGPCNELPLVEG